MVFLLEDLIELGLRRGVTSYCLLLFLDHPNLEPRHFVDEKVVNENHKDFMFLECILFITEVRTGRFVPREVLLTLKLGSGYGFLFLLCLFVCCHSTLQMNHYYTSEILSLID